VATVSLHSTGPFSPRRDNRRLRSRWRYGTFEE
jgi:hypothetical protein